MAWHQEHIALKFWSGICRCWPNSLLEDPHQSIVCTYTDESREAPFDPRVLLGMFGGEKAKHQSWCQTDLRVLQTNRAANLASRHLHVVSVSLRWMAALAASATLHLQAVKQHEPATAWCFDHFLIMFYLLLQSCSGRSLCILHLFTLYGWERWQAISVLHELE